MVLGPPVALSGVGMPAWLSSLGIHGILALSGGQDSPKSLVKVAREGSLTHSLYPEQSGSLFIDGEMGSEM